MFGKHPSPELQKLFNGKAYQGQTPKLAKVIIVGIDANYAYNLDQDASALELVKEYHNNGVKFWLDQEHKDANGFVVHHPFLDKNYPKGELRDGWKYHSNFHRMGLSPNCSGCISFIELLDVPTFGTAKTREEKEVFLQLFNQAKRRGHLKFINDVIIGKFEHRKLVLLCDRVIRKIDAIKAHEDFSWLPDPDDKTCAYKNKIKDLKLGLSNDVYEIYHFSYPRNNTEIMAIKELIEEYCRGVV